MKKLYLLIIILISAIAPLQGQNTQTPPQMMNDSLQFNDYSTMFEVLWCDYFSEKEHRKEKRDCFTRYTSLLLKTVYGQITAPVVYPAYYIKRKQITKRLEEFYKANNLENIENVGKDIVSGKINKDSLRSYLGSFYYNLWLYGDTDEPLGNGGVPDDYKKNLPMSVRRWFYSGVRNPRWNATYINDYSTDVVFVSTPYDTRTDIQTSNYGTGDTKLGCVLRWYVDNNGEWWFFYENTRLKTSDKGKLFYFGAVGLGQKDNGIQKKERKPGRFEFSLNRTVTLRK